MPRKYSDEEFKRINYEIFIWLLTFLSIFNVFLVVVFRDEVITAVIQDVNFLLGLIFLVDFFIRIQGAESRRTYFLKNYGWLDLLSALPILGMQLARVVRFVRTTRLLRASGEENIIRQVITNRANTALLSIGFFVVLLLEFGSLAILDAEAGATNANINTANEAIWWVLVTISTVGYGDYLPVTQYGRFVATLVIIAGVAVFGTLSGYLAKLFLGEDQTKKQNLVTLQKLVTQIEQMQQEQAEIKQLVQTENDTLQTRLTGMEQLLKQALSKQDS